MEMYKSKKGETGTKEYWKQELESFWKIFEDSKKKDPDHLKKLPDRPLDAWERFKRILGLVKVG